MLSGGIGAGVDAVLPAGDAGAEGVLTLLLNKSTTAVAIGGGIASWERRLRRGERRSSGGAT